MAEPGNKRRYMTPSEAAEFVGISASLIYQLVEERRLSHYRVGGKGKRGKILIDPEDLSAFLEAQKVEARS